MKQVTLILCCLAFFSVFAQPKMQKTESRKQKADFFEKFNKEIFSKRNTNWWEPDTIYMYDEDNPYPLERRVFSYDKGKCTIDLTQIWNDEQWVDDEKVTYTYDIQNNMTEILAQIWNWDSEKWENEERMIYTYDSQNNIDTSVYQFWIFGQWDNIWKEINAYDAQNNIIEIIAQEWETQWVNSEKCSNSYNTFNNLEESLYEYWEDGEWNEFWKETYSYNELNNITELLYEILENDQWENSCYQIFYYFNIVAI